MNVYFCFPVQVLGMATGGQHSFIIAAKTPSVAKVQHDES